MNTSTGVSTLGFSFRKWIYQSATRLLGDAEGLVELPVLSGPARGLRFRLRLTSNSEGSIFLGTYERQVARRLAEVCKSGWVVWDCGTFIGYYTLLFARRVGAEGRVVAFEPDPSNFRRTQANALLNHFSNVQLREFAVGGPVGELTFVSTHNQTSHLAGTYVGGSHLKGAEQPDKNTLIRVQCLSPDEIFNLQGVPRPHLIKLDLEGAEAEALKYMDRLIDTVRPLIAVELHNPECDEAMWKFCESYRYDLTSLVTGRAIHAQSDLGGIVLATPR